MENKINPWNKDSYKVFFMALPFIIFIFIFSYLPLWGWIYSFFNYKPGYKLLNCEFVGLDHFASMFSNPVLRDRIIQVLKNTIGMAGLGILFSPLSPMFAIFLNEMNSRVYKRAVQSLTTLPHYISWVIMYSLVFFIFSTSGFVNNLLTSLDIIDVPTNFMISTEHIWIKMQALGIWKGLGWGAIVYLAAISGIDTELYEAATVDGANRFQRIWHITVPGLIPTYFVLLIMALGNFLNVGMEQYLVFQNAMNKETIEVLDLYVYNQGLGAGNISFATAVGMLKSIVAIILFAFANNLSKLVRGDSVF